MFRFFTTIILITSALAIFLFFYKVSPSRSVADNNPNDSNTESISGSISAPDANIVTYDGNEYRYHFRKIAATDTVILIPNFADKASSSEIVDKYKCAYGINGGFYTEGNKPLGLFYADGTSLGSLIENPTFNGFLTKQKHSHILQNMRMIGSGNIEEAFEFALQSGPYFDLAAGTLHDFVDKSYARRSLVAESLGGNIYFFSIFGSESRYSGPRLEDIPKIFAETDIANIANFISVLNLDGGSASAYYDKASNTSIKELKPIGSFLCGTN